MSTRLLDHFEKVFVINLPYKEDRRKRLDRHLRETGLAQSEDVTWVRAISGDYCPPPAYFEAGGGAWGCLQSHLRLVQDAIMDGLESFIVLEDDVFFHEQAGENLARFMAEVPDDWDQIYFGGQHLKDPEPIDGKPFVFRCRNVNRTHAFALRKKVFQRYQQHIAHAPDYIAHGGWHIDHQLGLAHERGAWATYAPTWWLAGQDQGVSNISGRVTPRYWWHYYGFSEKLPFVHFPPQSLENQWEFIGKHLHFGNNLKPNTVEDVALDECVGSRPKLMEWLCMISREAMDLWKIPAISHPNIRIEEVAALWNAEVMDFNPKRVPGLLNYPRNGLFPHALNEAR